MKRLLLVFAGLMVGMAHAQTVNWDTAFASCSQEAAAFDRWAVEKSMYWENEGTIATWRHVRRNYKSSTIDVPSTRQALQSNRALLSKGPHPAAALDVCVMQAALNQVQSGSRSGAPEPSKREAQDNQTQCVRGRSFDSALVNECGRRVSVAWCSLPHDRSSSTNYHCESQRFSWVELSPGDKASVDDNAQIASITCDAPARPVNVRYVSGRGLQGKCQP